MKGIVIYSKTGNTLGVANMMKERANYPLMRVIPESDDPNVKEPKLTEAPDVSSFDELIVGSPVHGFMLANVMRVYLEQTDFSGKNVDLFITHFFPFAWMGGTHTLKQMKKIIEKRGGIVRRMTPINWKNKHREDDIKHLVENYTS